MKIFKIAWTIIVTLSLITASIFLFRNFNLGGNWSDFWESFIVVQSNEEVVILFILWIGILNLFCHRWYEMIFLELSKNAKEVELVGEKKIKNLALLLLLSALLYIFALITTSISNMGPMLFGGVFALFILEYQGVIEIINKFKIKQKEN
ncbi:hypothetical protein [Solibacillus ferritrahens]|uniref:hypothetical protein n=1 Tax=Solibacillus ferritrahens TaxID=3098620 RepID=UPI003008F4A7